MAKTPSEKSSQRQHEAMPEGAEFGTGVAKAAAERLLGEDRPPNVIGFGHGVKWTNNQPTGDDALLVFVEQKLDVPAAERVPAEIGGKQTDVVTLLAKSLGVVVSGRRQVVGGAQGVDAGGASLGGGVGVEPGAEAQDVEGDAGEDILQVGLGHAAVAGVAEVGAADGLGD